MLQPHFPISLISEQGLPSKPQTLRSDRIKDIVFSPRILFADMNAFYASVEQQERPELRGRPIIVVPALVDSTSAIAASYEAKALKISTGTPVWQAREICPSIAVVEARPFLYEEYSERIFEALKNICASTTPYSIDEFALIIPETHRTSETVLQLAEAVKFAVRSELGSFLTCSIGIGSNVFLAKVAADFRKPDGLTIFGSDYPSQLATLQMTDLPGIGARMNIRLRKAGIDSVIDLFNASRGLLRSAFRSELGGEWYDMIRGDPCCDYKPSRRKSVAGLPRSIGNSTVLHPNLRNEKGAAEIAQRVTSKALTRLRQSELVAEKIVVQISEKNWKDGTFQYWTANSSILPGANSDRVWRRVVAELTNSYHQSNSWRPWNVGIRFLDLSSAQSVVGTLFDTTSDTDRKVGDKISALVDEIRSRFGESAIDFGSSFWVRHEAPHRISFGPPGYFRPTENVTDNSSDK